MSENQSSPHLSARLGEPPQKELIAKWRAKAAFRRRDNYDAGASDTFGQCADELAAALTVGAEQAITVERIPLSEDFKAGVQRNLNIGRGYSEDELCPACGVVKPCAIHEAVGAERVPGIPIADEVEHETNRTVVGGTRRSDGDSLSPSLRAHQPERLQQRPDNKADGRSGLQDDGVVVEQGKVWGSCEMPDLHRQTPIQQGLAERVPSQPPDHQENKMGYKAKGKWSEDTHPVEAPHLTTQTTTYPCGCTATGGPDLPTYCPDHGVVPASSPTWHDIKTAPKDGTRIRLKRVYEGNLVSQGEGYFGAVTIHYTEGPKTFKNKWANADGVHFFPEPTHWAELEAAGVPSPPPPTEPPYVCCNETGPHNHGFGPGVKREDVKPPEARRF